MLYYKRSIKKLNYEMVAVMQDKEEEYIMRKQKRKVVWGILFYVLTVYLSLSAYGVESLRKAIVEGYQFSCATHINCLTWNTVQMLENPEIMSTPFHSNYRSKFYKLNLKKI